MGDRSALAVAIGTYRDPELRQLRAPAKDAESLTDVLADPAIGAFEVRTVVDQPSYQIARELEQFFAHRGLDDLLLLYLSCHGVKDDDGRLFFAATNTERQWLDSTAVSDDYVRKHMDRCRARSVVLLLDCCYSGAFQVGAKGDAGVQLKERLEGHGRAVLTASNALEYAWEGERLSGQGHASLFTDAIVEGLRSGDADRDRDGVVSVTDLYDHVYDRVSASKRGQRPQLWALGLEKNVYLARNPWPKPIEPGRLPAEIQEELESLVPSRRLGIIGDLTRHLSSANRSQAMAAQLALERLCEDDSRRVAAAAADVLATNRVRSSQVQPMEPTMQALDTTYKVAPVPEVGAETLLTRGAQLVNLGRREEAVRTFDEVVQRFGATADIELRRVVARSLVSKGVVLEQLGEHEKAIAAYDDVVELFGGAPDLELRRRVAMALANHGIVLRHLGQHNDAIQTYDELAVRFREASEVELRVRAAKALFDKGEALKELGRIRQAKAAYREVVSHFEDSVDPALLGLVSRAREASVLV